MTFMKTPIAVGNCSALPDTEDYRTRHRGAAFAAGEHPVDQRVGHGAGTRLAGHQGTGERVVRRHEISVKVKLCVDLGIERRNRRSRRSLEHPFIVDLGEVRHAWEGIDDSRVIGSMRHVGGNPGDLILVDVEVHALLVNIVDVIPP